MARILAILFGILLIIGIFYVGYRLRGGDIGNATPELNVDLQEIMPEGWVAEGKGLARVTIDEDEQAEWLLFYSYDGGAQIGGVIYDAQNRPRGDTSVPIPEQSSAYLVPYRLLPDYHVPKTTGYLANKAPDYDKSYDYKVILQELDPKPAKDMLEIRGFQRGRVNRFSIFWWLDEQSGYAGAQASTPGWFSLSETAPNDWTLWNEGAPFITKLWAWEPQTDRSNLCRRALWRLDMGEENPALDSKFVGFYDGDITFCSGIIPQDPAFPEGQVLAYLRDGRKDRWLDENAPNIPSYNDVIVQRITSPLVLDKPAGENVSLGEASPVEVEVDFTVDELQRRENLVSRDDSPENHYGSC